jgi:CHASE2 domain-containing sensor protein
MTLMSRLRRAAITLHAGFVRLLPGEFRRRHRAEIQLDFAEDLHRCATAREIGLTAARDCGDLVVSAAREWWGSESLKLLIYAGLAHAGIWLIGVAVAAWQWPRGPRLYPVVISFAVLSAAGIAVTLWRQRRRIHRTAYCSLSVAELD